MTEHEYRNEKISIIIHLAVIVPSPIFATTMKRKNMIHPSINHMNSFARIRAATILIPLQNHVAPHKESFLCDPRFGKWSPMTGKKSKSGAIVCVNFGLDVGLARILDGAADATLEPGKKSKLIVV